MFSPYPGLHALARSKNRKLSLHWILSTRAWRGRSPYYAIVSRHYYPHHQLANHKPQRLTALTVITKLTIAVCFVKYAVSGAGVEEKILRPRDLGEVLR